MAQPILTQILGVSHRRDDRGHEGLIYAPTPLIGDGRPAPEPAYKSIQAAGLTRRIEAVRNTIEELNWRGRLREPRAATAIEPVAEQLGNYVLPEQGFLSVIEPGVHPQFDIVYDAASSIPWEILDERYASCTCRQPTVIYRRLRDVAPLHCEYCGRVMPIHGGKLAIDRHLTHLVRGGKPASSEGGDFLIVEDPTDDLCSAETDPSGECRQHLAQLKAMLQQAGYRLSIVARKNATSQRLLQSLDNPQLVGLYYFGHGLFAQDADQGCLLLADGPLYASEIEQANPNIRFTFLNACEGGATGNSWALERRVRSVGHAFARGGATKTVIAPLWPVLAYQAARAAVTFFRQAIGGQSLADALCDVRRESLQRYQQGEADIMWMAYRYFGDPNRFLPPPSAPTAPASSVPDPQIKVGSRLFNRHGQLDLDQFDFDFAAVLLRAAKRRNAHQREQINVFDILAGLIRAGHLTRYTLQSIAENPDTIYQRLSAPRTGEVPGAAAQLEGAGRKPGTGDAHVDQQQCDNRVERLKKFLSAWIVRSIEDFDADTQAWLEQAERRAQHRGGERVAEGDLLAVLAASPRWTKVAADLCPQKAHELTDRLSGSADDGVVDQNGALNLDHVTPLARRVIDGAHELAQQRGCADIPNRLMLAALLNEPDGSVAQACRQMQIDAAALAQLLIAGTSSRPPQSFALSPEAAQRVVLPMLARAAQLRDDTGALAVTEALMFCAFCDVVAPQLKHLLRSLPAPYKVNLDQLRGTVYASLSAGSPSLGSPLPAAAGTSTSSAAEPMAVPPLSALDEAAAAPAAKAAGQAPTAPQPIELAIPLQQVVEEVLQAAAECAVMQGHTDIRSVHLLAGLISRSQGFMLAKCRKHDVRPEQLCLAALRIVRPQVLDAHPESEVSLSENSHRILTAACHIARRGGRTSVGEQDLWRAMLANRQQTIVQLLQHLGHVALANDDAEDRAPDAHDALGGASSLADPLVMASDLSQRRRDGKLSPIIGRTSELGCLLRKLSAGADAHPVLIVGHRGVGKTALVEGLADWIVDGLCPSSLQDRPVLEVSVPRFIAATRFTDETPQRLRQLAGQLGQREAIIVLDDVFEPAGQHSAMASSIWEAMIEPLLGLARTQLVMTIRRQTYTAWCDQRGSTHFAVDVIELDAMNAQQSAAVVDAQRQRLGERYALRIEPDVAQRAVALMTAAGRQHELPGAAVALVRQACDRVAGHAAVLKARHLDQEGEETLS